MPLETIEGSSGAPPGASIIILHGLGADANDFVSFAQQLDLGEIGNVRFVFPNAPVRPIALFGGQHVRAWFDVYEADLVRREDKPSLRESASEIQALIDREVERGIPSSRIVLAGFSQGCAMTLMTGLRAPQRLAGLLGLSGWLPLADTTSDEASAANRDVPIFLGHGTADAIVPYARGTAARDTLAGLGYPVEFHDYPMQHSVSNEEIEAANAWLSKVLART